MKVLKHGDAIVFFDSYKVPHNAVVTNVFGDGTVHPQGCNLAYTSSDQSRTDSYGRQIERATSVVHISMNPAKACCWSWSEEVAA